MTESRIVEITVEPGLLDHVQEIRALALGKAGIQDNPDLSVRIARRSIDARSHSPKYILRMEIRRNKEAGHSDEPVFRPLSLKPLGPHKAVIVGSGPAGYFAALKLLEKGIRPLVLERGKDVNSRRKDIKKIYSEGLIHPHSNYCFGEGGAGTFSDGKLYTRASKRGDIDRILSLLVQHGASPDIMVDSHPHVGSNILPRVVSNIRKSILQAGGDIRFDAFVDDFFIKDGRITGVQVNGSEIVTADTVILATGHSARDIFRLLARKGLKIEAKPFALGVRIEHPQEVIDRIFYRNSPRHSNLPPAEYRIACQIEDRGVYSFCMCPGGFVVPAATAPGELVLNGMSMSGRGAPFANAGLVVELRLEDMGDPNDPLSALAFQEAVEKAVFAAGDTSDQKAPAQMVPDFIRGKISPRIDESSYIPGLYSAPLHEILPKGVVKRLRNGLQELNRKYRGYADYPAKIMAVESRTSSPVRIIRDSQTLMHPVVIGLYPCGEGAGYAGGIVSAAMDGEAVAEAVSRKLQGQIS